MPANSEPPRRDPAEKAKERADIFDKLCQRRRWSIADLLNTPPERVAALLKASGHPADARLLGPWIQEYCAGKSTGVRTGPT